MPEIEYWEVITTNTEGNQFTSNPYSSEEQARKSYYFHVKYTGIKGYKVEIAKTTGTRETIELHTFTEDA